MNVDLNAIGALIDLAWRFLAIPLEEAPWTDWRGFWLGRIFDGRFVVIYFMSWVFVLMLLRGRALRYGVVLTGLLFLSYVFGVAYAGLWLLTCALLYRLGESFARECQRTDVLKIGPPLAAGLIIGGGYVASMLLHRIPLPGALNTWVYEYAPWLLPFGVRGLEWEPFFRPLHSAPAAGGPPQPFHALFWDVHMIGTAYLTVRMFQYFSEIKRGNLPAEQRSPLRFLAFTCYAPLLIQGPIERYQPFQDAMDTCHQNRGWHNVPPALWRIGLGLSKSLVGELYLAPIILGPLGLGYENTYYDHPERIDSFFLLYTGVVFQIAWLYLEFAGYCDIAVGMSRLIGYRVHENFRFPWVSTSMRDFWRRWHLTLSFILRDYVYIALGGNRRHPVRNVLLTFVLCGIWHAITAQAAAWGFVMGVCVLVNQWWVRWMERLDARAATAPSTAAAGLLPQIRRHWTRVPVLPTLLAWLVTMHAFHFTLLFLFGGGGALRVVAEIARRLTGG